MTIEELAALGAAKRVAEIRTEMQALERFLHPPVGEPFVRKAAKIVTRSRKPASHWTQSAAARRDVSAWMRRYWKAKREKKVAQANARLRAAVTRRRHVRQAAAAVVQAQVQ
jgi:hypothetical protein